MPFMGMAGSGSTPPIAASKLLGRGADGGTGAAEAVTLGGGLSMSGTTLSASGTAAPALTNGDVTTGTATTTSTVNAAQLKLAADTHAPGVSVAASRLLGRGSAGGTGRAEPLTVGTGLSISGTVLNATADPAISDGDVTTGTATTPSLVTAAQLKLAATTHAPALSGDANNTLSAPPKFWCGTQANYDAIGSKGANTIYLIQA